MQQVRSLDSEVSALQVQLAAAKQEVDRLRGAVAASREREKALIHEVQHRVTNMLAVIRSVFRRSRESGASQDEFAEHFEGRFDAIARYQSYVDEVGSPGIDLEDMLRNELMEGDCLDGPRCKLSGPPVYLRQKSAELMGLVIHELTTNSIKFGALAHGGDLLVDWSIEQHEADLFLHFSWSETGVSVTTVAPRPSGFGIQLIEEALPYQLGATTNFTFKPGGIECSIALPLPPAPSPSRPRSEDHVEQTANPAAEPELE